MASLIDVPAPLGVMALLGLAGVIDTTPLQPPNDWFWSEWLLKCWLDAPEMIIGPSVGLFALTTLGWTLGEWIGWSLGMRIMKLQVTDVSGATPSPLQFLLRWVGWWLTLCLLGFGHAWGFVSPTRRTLVDYLSSTLVEAD